MPTGSSIIAAETAPTSDELWAMASLMRADWVTAIVVNTSWSTSIASARTDAESRWGLMGKPYRTIAFQLDTFDATQTAEARSILSRIGQARSLVPLFPDQSVVTAEASGTTIVCDTTCRRWSVGARVMIFNDAQPPAFETATITAIDPAFLTLAVALTTTYPAGSMVVPLLEADLIPASTIGFITDGMLSGTLTFIESTGASTLDPAAVPGTTLDFNTYDGYPIIDIDPDYSGATATQALGIQRTANVTNVGTGRYTEVFGDRGRYTYTLVYNQLDRASAWRLMQFFDCRAGQLFPFFLVSPVTDFTVVSIGTTTISVTALTPSYDWTFRTHIAVVLATGVLLVRAIASVARADGVDTVTLTDDLPAITDQVIRVTLAHLVRFDTDELAETWLTDNKMSTSLNVLEVVREMNVDLDIPPITVGGSLPGWGDGTDPGDGGPVTDVWYRQLKRCGALSYTGPWAPEAGLGTLPVTLLNPRDYDCYTVGTDSPRSNSVTGYIVGWWIVTDCEDPLCPIHATCSDVVADCYVVTGTLTVNEWSGADGTGDLIGTCTRSFTYTLTRTETCVWAIDPATVDPTSNCPTVPGDTVQLSFQAVDPVGWMLCSSFQIGPFGGCNIMACTGVRLTGETPIGTLPDNTTVSVPVGIADCDAGTGSVSVTLSGVTVSACGGGAKPKAGAALPAPTPTPVSPEALQKRFLSIAPICKKCPSFTGFKENTMGQVICVGCTSCNCPLQALALTKECPRKLFPAMEGT